MMIADFEQAMVAKACAAQPEEEPEAVRDLLCAEVRALVAGDAGRHILSLMCAIRHPMGYPAGATPEETARLNGQREVVAFLVRWSESKPH